MGRKGILLPTSLPCTNMFLNKWIMCRMVTFGGLFCGELFRYLDWEYCYIFAVYLHCYVCGDCYMYGWYLLHYVISTFYISRNTLHLLECELEHLVFGYNFDVVAWSSYSAMINFINMTCAINGSTKWLTQRLHEVYSHFPGGNIDRQYNIARDLL